MDPYIHLLKGVCSMKLSILIKNVLSSIRLLIIYYVLLSFQYAFSGIVGDTKITGRVLKYDKHTVTLSQYRDQKVTVPRSSLKKNFKKLKTGIIATAVFSAEDIMDQIQAQTKK